MPFPEYRSEVRDSIIRDLLQKVSREDFGQYLLGMRLDRIRFFHGAQIRFDFPVTALIGPNGSGKSTVLGAAACAYRSTNPKNIFVKSMVGDHQMTDWSIEYEIIDKARNPKGIERSYATLEHDIWKRPIIDRPIKFFGINRTVSAVESARISYKRRFRGSWKKRDVEKQIYVSVSPVKDISATIVEAEKILGKALDQFTLYQATMARGKRERIPDSDSYIFETNNKLTPGYRLNLSKKEMDHSSTHYIVGRDGQNSYSEFNFGAGEASVIRIVADIERLPLHALVLIEEIENGLHPVAVNRMVEYLISVAKRKNIQTIFTTHSDHALVPLPSEAIWSSIDGRLQQGKLSIETLRAVSGRIDRRLAIFVEDGFAKHWVQTVLREKLGAQVDEVGVYSVGGDGNAVRTHLGHISNPSIGFHSLCFVDGNSEQKEDPANRIYRLPGRVPESTIFDSVISNLENNIALLTIASQTSASKQDQVSESIRLVSRTNRDPHLLFSQVGNRLGFTPEAIVRGAFLSVWIQENSGEADRIAELVKGALDLPLKN